MKLPSVEVSTAESVSELASAMLEKGATSVLITENQKPIGMISDRDLLKEIVENQKDPKKTCAKDLKYTPLIMLTEGESMPQVLKMMRAKGLGRVAMVKNGQLVGMLTENLATKKAN